MYRTSPKERDLRIDHLILFSLQESLLQGNLGLIDLSDQSVSIPGSTPEIFRRRLFRLIGQECVAVFPIGAIGEITIEEQEYLLEHPESMPSVRITSHGFARLAEIEHELIDYTGIRRHLAPIRETLSRLYAMRGIGVAGLTTVLILSIFVFDVKVSRLIEHTPLLSSVIDTELLQEFESVNEGDEFYQALMTEDASSDDTSSVTGATDSNSTWSTAPSSSAGTSQTPISRTAGIITIPEASVRKENLVTIPPVVQKTLPAGVKILEIKVRTLSDLEKIFRISLEDGTLHDVRVMKVGDRFRIVDEDIQRSLRR